MGDLSCFLAQNAIKVENVKHLLFQNGSWIKHERPIEWEICCITPAEDEALKKRMH